MKKVSLLNSSILIYCLGFATLFSFAQNDIFFDRANVFFRKYCFDGKVNYAEIAANPDELNSLINTIGLYDSAGIDSLSKAFYINAYNLFVIKQIVDNYPVPSPQNISGFFEGNKFKLGPQMVTLNDLETKILRKQFGDYRLHFVLVCGALGCPKIGNFAYQPKRIEEQLESQTKRILNDSNFVFEKEGKVQLSQIFNWFREDFGSNQELLEIINRYRVLPLRSSSFNYYAYNWQLNDARKALEVFGNQPREIIDSGLNMQTYSPGTLLAKGYWDLTLFNSLYTQTKSNWLGVDYDGIRESFYTTLLQVTLGTNKNKRVNVGFDISFRGSAKRLNDRIGSAFDVFSFKNNDSTRVGISSVGPRIKWIPFAGNTNFTLQTTFTVPTTRYNEGKSNLTGNLYWLDWSRFVSWNQFFYTYTRGRFQLFSEADLLVRIRTSKSQITHVDVPITLISSFFPTSKWTVYAICQHNTRYTYNINPTLSADFVIPMNYSALGLGIKFQPMNNIILEMLYTNFVRGINSGLGESFNFGIKYLTK